MIKLDFSQRYLRIAKIGVSSEIIIKYSSVYNLYDIRPPYQLEEINDEELTIDLIVDILIKSQKQDPDNKDIMKHKLLSILKEFQTIPELVKIDILKTNILP